MKSIRYRYGEDSFEWDAAKAEINAAKHGVDFAEAASAFDDFEAFITDDPNHSLGERREILVGYSLKNRLITVVFTERTYQDGILIRLISARRATRYERNCYEEN